MKPLPRLLALVCALLLGPVALTHAAEDRDAKVRSDRTDVLSGGLWIYNDLAKGLAEAAQTGKPLLVVFRCIP